MSLNQKTTASRKKSSAVLAAFTPTVLRITKKYSVKNVRIFGSYARDEQKKTSDIDLLVDLPHDMSLFAFSGLKLDLEQALGRKVDLVSGHSIKPALRHRILSEARAL